MPSKSAQDRLRTSFILDAIAQAEKIQVEEAEVEQRIVQLAQRGPNDAGAIESAVGGERRVGRD